MRLSMKSWIGIAILIIIVVSYFITIEIDSGFNYTTNSKLLGILIFHNPFVLALYILIGIILIFYGFRRRKVEKKR